MEEISRKQYIFSISTTKKVSVRDDGYLGLSIKKTKEMYELHKELLRFLSPLRDKNIKIDPAIPKHRRELIKRYGTSNAGEAYHPHITIGLVDPIELSKGKKMLSKTPKLKYYVKEIALCQSEPLHTCRRVVARFKLSNK